MKGLPKEVLTWIAIVIGKILLGMIVWQMNKVNDNLEDLNQSVTALYRITDRMEVRQAVVESRIKFIESKLDEHDLEFKEIYKQQLK